MNNKWSKAFTLIELVIVITIIGVMITIPVVGYAQVTKKSRDTRRKQDIDKINTALSQYRAENGKYPIESTYAALSADLVPTFLTQLPVDPRNSGVNVYYYSSTDGESFTLYATLENTVGGNNEKYVATMTGGISITGAPAAPSSYLSPTGFTPFNYSPTPSSSPTPSRTPTPTP
jgi:prepilin-type N-terminal cleavage/methylation domain-containing protein